MRLIILLLSFGLGGGIYAQSDCGPEHRAKAGTYEVRIIPGSVESTAVKPRTLSEEELCMVEEKRHKTEYITLKLDLYTEVRIYPSKEITEK